MMIAVRRYVSLCILTTSLVSGDIRNVGWWNNTVFYQIYPRSFMDSDGDGVGDLPGITSKLDYFVDTGVGAIWLSPICKSPMVDFGYDISDFKDIDPVFGNLTDFEDLINQAHKRNLKVILDLVPNHSSDQHEWFKQSVAKNESYTDYYTWKPCNEGKQLPNNWLSLFNGPAWTYHAVRKECYLHQFEYRQPDLNYRNPGVQQELKDIIVFWLDKGVDGFRIDAIPYAYEDVSLQDEIVDPEGSANKSDYTHLVHTYTKDHPQTYDLIRSWRQLVDDYASAKNQSQKVLMTEAYTTLDKTLQFYNFGSNIPFNFQFIVKANSASNADDFKRIIDEWMYNKPNYAVANWVMGNHDNKRIATRYPGKTDQINMLSMILPGVAVTYYGDELGMSDKPNITYEQTQDPQGKLAGPAKYQEVSRDPARTPFQWNDTEPYAGFSTNNTWLPVHENYKELNLEKEKNDPTSHYNLYKELIALRNSSSILKEGSLRTVVPGNNRNVLAIIRSKGNDSLTLVINLSGSTSQTVDLSHEISPKAIVELASGGILSKGATVDTNSITLKENAALLLRTISADQSNAAADIFGSSPLKLVVSLVLLLLFSQL